jgi:stage V sporulation protein SpoVS
MEDAERSPFRIERTVGWGRRQPWTRDADVKERDHRTSVKVSAHRVTHDRRHARLDPLDHPSLRRRLGHRAAADNAARNLGPVEVRRPRVAAEEDDHHALSEPAKEREIAKAEERVPASKDKCVVREDCVDEQEHHRATVESGPDAPQASARPPALFEPTGQTDVSARTATAIRERIRAEIQVIGTEADRSKARHELAAVARGLPHADENGACLARRPVGHSALS